MNDNLTASSQHGDIDELIVARATATGAGALAVIRVDGAGTRELLNRMFKPAGPASPTDSPRTMVFGRWIDPDSGDGIDEGLCTYFAAPRSFTGNDVAEFHCHGGAVPVRRIIEACLALGARPAEPGEFTRRAFLNGRMDLAQAEAVADLINAQTDEAASLAQRQLSGELSLVVGALRETLIILSAEIEARIDFPEEDIEPKDRARLETYFTDLKTGLARLLESRKRGALMREGARVVLAGRPNAGKSSLLNLLAHHERAIVTPHAGTTRDTIECTIDLQGIPLILIDTAGLRRSEDPIEKIGIDRTRQEIEQADLVMHIIDATERDRHPEAEVIEMVGRRSDLIVYNKIDLLTSPDLPNDGIPLSAERGDGIEALETALIELLVGQTTGEATGFAVSLRHADLLDQCIASLATARTAFDDQLSGEFVMVDLSDALNALSAILGMETGEAVIDRIFSQFCLGK